jgi:DNA mismatch repair protein MutS
MMKQYREIKKDLPDTILFYRMGDFYEMFFDDAETASRILGLTLTSRNHGKSEKVPLAGIPHHACESYLKKLIRAGYKVAICEQVEDPKKAKGIVRREVVEIVTPGTLVSSTLLEHKKNNYLVSLVPGEKGTMGYARIDLSTGEFSLAEMSWETLMDELLRDPPAEILIGESFSNEFRTRIAGMDFEGITFSELPDWEFSPDVAREHLLDHFRVSTLDGFGISHCTAGIMAAGAVLAYLGRNSKAALAHINRIVPLHLSEGMVLDPMTQRNLELVQSLSGSTGEHTLLHVIDHTFTAMGGRLLRHWILNPMTDRESILKRQEAVKELAGEHSIRQRTGNILQSVSDIERIAGKLGCERANARDCVSLKDSLLLLPRLLETISGLTSSLFRELETDLAPAQDVISLVQDAVIDDPPFSLREGRIIRDKYDEKVDHYRTLVKDGKGWISRLEASERERTGISSLKVRFNRVFGYYIEVSKPNLHLVPDDYVRKQTLVNHERFYTPALKEREIEVLQAEERICEREYEIFLTVRGEVTKHLETIQANARAAAVLDCLLSLAICAAEHRYVPPVITDDPLIRIEGGRHPVLELLMAREGFVPNDTDMDAAESQIVLITGPNMAGKSTYLRQVGLIVLLAQIGSLVPADRAEIGIVDRIFTRVGATDKLWKGQSTFLVEMVEMANILHNCTGRSLLLLDEVGRGTATFDGLSLAWAITEHLHDESNANPRTLFATHYHELTDLGRLLPRVTNCSIAVREWKDEIIFLRKIVDGPADRSYGVQVARLAGLPLSVIDRAKELLRELEEKDRELVSIESRKPEFREKYPVADQLSLFSIGEDRIRRMLREIDTSRMTPLEALNTIDRLKKEALS